MVSRLGPAPISHRVPERPTGRFGPASQPAARLDHSGERSLVVRQVTVARRPRRRKARITNRGLVVLLLLLAGTEVAVVQAILGLMH